MATQGGAPATVFRTELNPVDLLTRAAAMYAETTAVVHGARRYTYAELGERAWRLANALRDRGLRKGDRVATLLPNCPAMLEAHPTEPHWYLNIVATLPSERSRGLGAAVLAPILARADAEALPCYLESTNPRNHTLYHRHGFEDLGDIHLDEGVSLRQMWRPPYSR